MHFLQCLIKVTLITSLTTLSVVSIPVLSNLELKSTLYNDGKVLETRASTGIASLEQKAVNEIGKTVGKTIGKAFLGIIKDSVTKSAKKEAKKTVQKATK
ncbi:hypothetical protein HI914_01962 [Erysiphe necator]|nr:hypothetical protein HI914_01962 [Erysiphe necator]